MAGKGVNKVILVGNLGTDPEMRYFNDGTAVCNFSVATSESWKNKNGEKQEKTEWHRVAVFRKLAEICGQYLRKGSKVYLEGKLQTRSWEKDGITRYTTEIVVNEMQMLDSPNQNQQGGYQQQHGYPSQQPAQPYQQQQGGFGGGGYSTTGGDFTRTPLDEDIPF